MIYQMWIKRTVAASESSALEDVLPALERKSLLPRDFELSNGMGHADVLSEIEENLSSASVQANLYGLRDNEGFMAAFRELARAMGLRCKLKRFRSAFDRAAGHAFIAFEYEGRQHQCAWSLDEPWENEIFLEFMNGAFSDSTGKELIAFDQFGGSTTVYVVAKGSAALVQEVADCAKLESDPDLVKTGKVMASGTISVVGLIATFLAVWMFLGLMKALLISLAVWAVFFAIMFVVHHFSARGEKRFLQMDDGEEAMV